MITENSKKRILRTSIYFALGLTQPLGYYLSKETSADSDSFLFQHLNDITGPFGFYFIQRGGNLLAMFHPETVQDASFLRKAAGVYTLGLCYLFEFSQYISNDQKFSAGYDPKDFAMYTLGVITAVVVDKTIRKRINLDEIIESNK